MTDEVHPGAHLSPATTCNDPKDADCGTIVASGTVIIGE